MKFRALCCLACLAFVGAVAGACSSSSSGSSPDGGGGGGNDAGADRVVEAGPGPGCLDSDCAPGNVCIDDGSGKGASCHLACTTQGQCPFGYYCNDADPVSWCVASSVSLTQTMGQWGTSCNPGDGETNNPACDSKSGFECYAHSPMDATAYCTFIGCTTDSQCPGGWWCERVDTAPNAGTDTRSFGQTRNVCVPRAYCAPCVTDHDCATATGTPGTVNATPQHCVKDAHGVGLCSPVCSNDTTCNLDATCKQLKQCEDKSCTKDADCGSYGGSGHAMCIAGACRVTCASNADCSKAGGSATGSEVCDPASKTCRPSSCAAGGDGGACIESCSADADCGFGRTCASISACIPRAGECVGMGGFCDPCRSDADCASGAVCLDTSPYSTERTCSVPVMGTCPTDGGSLAPGACPKPPTGSAAAASGTSCTGAANSLSTANQCIPLDNIGGPCNAANPGNCTVGCWSVIPM